MNLKKAREIALDMGVKVGEPFWDIKSNRKIFRVTGPRGTVCVYHTGVRGSRNCWIVCDLNGVYLFPEIMSVAIVCAANYVAKPLWERTLEQLSYRADSFSKSLSAIKNIETAVNDALDTIASEMAEMRSEGMTDDEWEKLSVILKNRLHDASSKIKSWYP